MTQTKKQDRSNPPTRPFKRLWCDEKTILQLPNCTLRVYLAHRLHEDPSGQSWPTIPLIQAETGLSANAIDDARAWLKKHGWLVFTGWYRRNIPKYRTAIGTIPKSQEKRGGNTQPTPKIGVGHTKAATPNNGGRSDPTNPKQRPRPTPIFAPRPTPNNGVAATPNFGVRKDIHKVDSGSRTIEGKDSPSDKSILLNQSPVQHLKDSSKEALDVAMALYRESNPAYAKLANSLIPDEDRKALDGPILNEAVQVALEICMVLGENLGTKDRPRSDWMAFYVRLKTANPTITVKHACDIVTRIINQGETLEPCIALEDFAKLANASQDEHVKACACGCPTGPAMGAWMCDVCEGFNTGEGVSEAAQASAANTTEVTV
jgi:hypothetical protein